MHATMSIELATATASCPECGQSFDYDSAEAFGISLKPARCWDCTDRLRVEAENAERERASRLVSESWRAWMQKNCPALVDGEKWLAHCNPVMRSAGATWAATPQHKGIGLIGPTGCGKTTVALLALRECHRRGATIGYADAIRLAEAANLARWGFKSEQGFARQTIAEWKECGYLLLDDIGQAAANGNEDADSVLFELVKSRCEAARPIIWTCQGSDAWLLERLGPVRGPAVIRRLVECCDVTSLFKA